MSFTVLWRNKTNEVTRIPPTDQQLKFTTAPFYSSFCLNTTFLSYVKIDWIATAQPKLHDYKAVDVNQPLTFQTLISKFEFSFVALIHVHFLQM